MTALYYRLIVAIAAIVGMAWAIAADASSMATLIWGVLAAFVGVAICLAIRLLQPHD